jgi:hypothetical protein
MENIKPLTDEDTSHRKKNKHNIQGLSLVPRQTHNTVLRRDRLSNGATTNIRAA